MVARGPDQVAGGAVCSEASPGGRAGWRPTQPLCGVTEKPAAIEADRGANYSLEPAKVAAHKGFAALPCDSLALLGFVRVIA
jgi:hypothetical protein